MSMIRTTNSGDRLESLKELARILAKEIDNGDGKTIPSLARQYRETIREIEEIEGNKSDGDEIADILSEREANGKAGAVR